MQMKTLPPSTRINETPLPPPPRQCCKIMYDNFCNVFRSEMLYISQHCLGGEGGIICFQDCVILVKKHWLFPNVSFWGFIAQKTHPALFMRGGGCKMVYVLRITI